jgi:hypothetical protein
VFLLQAHISKRAPRDIWKSGSLAFVERDGNWMAVLGRRKSRMAVRRATAFEHHVTDGFFAFAAARADAEFELKFVERRGTIGDQSANFLV